MLIWLDPGAPVVLDEYQRSGSRDRRPLTLSVASKGAAVRAVRAERLAASLRLTIH